LTHFHRRFTSARERTADWDRSALFTGHLALPAAFPVLALAVGTARWLCLNSELFRELRQEPVAMKA
jgi:hypothetical protein